MFFALQYYHVYFYRYLISRHFSLCNFCCVLLSSMLAFVSNLPLKTHFAHYSIPDVVISNNGLQFSSERFAKFSKTWEFQHNTSTPGHSHSNGKAESAVKTAKKS